MIPTGSDTEAFGNWMKHNKRQKIALPLWSVLEMIDTNFERGELLKVTIPENWKPEKTVAKYFKLVQVHKITHVLILENKGNGIYAVLPCSTVSKGNAVPIITAENCYYVYIKCWQLESAILSRFENGCSFDKECIFQEIDQKFQERAERRHLYKERRKERKKGEPTIQEIAYNWPTKSIAEERRKKERLLSPPETSPKAQNHSPKKVTQFPKSIIGFERVSLSGLNRNAFKQKITLTNYTCNQCLECRNNLTLVNPVYCIVVIVVKYRTTLVVNRISDPIHDRRYRRIMGRLFKMLLDQVVSQMIVNNRTNCIQIISKGMPLIHKGCFHQTDAANAIGGERKGKGFQDLGQIDGNIVVVLHCIFSFHG